MADSTSANGRKTFLSSQLQKEQDDSQSNGNHESKSPSSRSSSRPRPWSSLELKPRHSPSPSFLEPSRTSKDDSYVPSEPVTPRRPNSSLARGLSLQMPPRDISSSSIANLTTNLANRVPLSPKLDSPISLGSATTVLPRRSRGLDFSRACTNLHHSTLAEQSSPDSSPIISGRGMTIPSRKSIHGASGMINILDSPSSTANSMWSTIPNVDRTGVSSSVGSISMMDSDSGSTSSDGDEMMAHPDDEDTIHGTPQFKNGTRNPFTCSSISSPGLDMISPFSPSAANLMSFQRARLRHGKKSRTSSSSISGRSSIVSPGPVSPPLLKSIESSINGGYFCGELDRKNLESRRESLSLGTNELNMSDGIESEDGEACRISPHDTLGIPIPITPNLDDRRSVIRRAVTRRGGNLLPKSKNFARIKAALQEEGSPIDTEVRREAEVVRQVRESDNDADSHLLRSQPTTSASSPTLLPVTTAPSSTIEDIPEDAMSTDMLLDRRPSHSFTHQAMKSSAGLEFWNSFDDRVRTPPPTGFPRGSSSSMSEDMNMDTPASSIISTTPHQYHSRPQQSRSRSSTPQPPSMATEFTRKIGKRRRDDDLDPYSIKRRAVSPGVSLQNSPILPPSPAQRDNGWWATQSKSNREVPNGHVTGERVNNGGNVNCLGPPKRIGFQGMCDTNDGLMNMSIE